MTPTQEQLNIIDAAVTTQDNLLVSALAGAAKTSTLVLIAEALPKTAMLCLAFNKKIATEMTERLPSNCVSMTLNALGHRVWAQTIGKRLNLDTKKTYSALSKAIEGLPAVEKSEAFELFADTLKAIESGKTCGYVPTGKFPNAKRLMDDDEFFAWLDEEPTNLQMQLIRAVTVKSIADGMAGTIDFNDQILLPTIFPSAFPKYPLVLVDEAQDLSNLNHATLRKLVKQRIIAVGDECQAIYGFRGAHHDSMNLLRDVFSMRRLDLTMSFRCPRSVVEAARWRAPAMKYPDWAKPGEVKALNEWGIPELTEDAVIICRNNSPIFYMAMNLLKNGRYPQIIGNDIGKSLIKILKKLGPNEMPRDEVRLAIEKWKEAKLKKSRNERPIHDQAECLTIFADQGKDLGEAIAYADHIMNSSGPIRLMTGHKSKGLEFDNVYFLDQHLLRLEEQQEQNLKYVIQTRAKMTLTYVNSVDFETEAEEKAA